MREIQNYSDSSGAHRGHLLLMMIAAIAFVAVIAVSAVSMADNSEASPVIEYEGVYYELFYDDDHAEVCRPYLGTYSGDIEIAATLEYGGHTLNVTTIKSSAFMLCKGMTSIDLKNVTTISNYAFEGCTGLTSMDLKNVATLKYGAFNGCTNLTEFKVNGDNIAFSVENGVLFSKDGATLISYPAGKSGSYTVPDSVDYIKYSAFEGCTGLTSIDLRNVATIDTNAFNGCTGLTSIDLKNVATINRYAFEDCTGLTSVDLKNVTSLDYEVFNGCTSLIEFKVDGSNTAYSVIDGVLFSKTGTDLFDYPAGKSGSYTVPNSANYVRDYAFKGCIGLTSVDLNNVTSISSGAFRDCTNLTSVDLKKLTYIGYDSFYGCTSLTEFKVDNTNTVYSASDGVLFNKEGTELVLCPIAKSGSYTVPDNVETIGSSAFSGCTGLTSINLMNVTYIKNNAFEDCTGLTSVDLMNVTTIGYSAFYKCTGLTSVDLKIITSIGDDAFYDCTSLAEFKVNDNNTVYSVVDGVIYNKACTELVLCPMAKSGSLTLPDSVTEIPEYAFYWYEGLTSIDLKNVTTIGDSAFNGCMGLTEFKVNDDNTAYSVSDGVLFNKAGTELVAYPAGKSGPYTVPDNVTTIGEAAFDNCTGLTSLDIKNVTTIGDYAFDGCTGLTSLDLKNVTTIGHGAFDGCISMTSVNMKNVTTIGDYAFDECTSLLTVQLPENPPALTEYAFVECPSEMRMIVKESALASYQSNADWQPYLNNIVVGSSITDATVDAIADQTYNGSAIEPTVTVKYGTTALVKGTDYTVTYSDNINAGTATVTLTGMGDYAGTKTVTFTIAPKAVVVKANDISKNLNEADPTLTATVTGLLGTDKVNYTLSRAAGEDAGRYVITASGDARQGNYTVTYENGTFTIASPSQSDSTGLIVALIIIVIAVVIIAALQFKKN